MTTKYKMTNRELFEALNEKLEELMDNMSDDGTSYNNDMFRKDDGLAWVDGEDQDFDDEPFAKDEKPCNCSLCREDRDMDNEQLSDEELIAFNAEMLRDILAEREISNNNSRMQLEKQRANEGHTLSTKELDEMKEVECSCEDCSRMRTNIVESKNKCETCEWCDCETCDLKDNAKTFAKVVDSKIVEPSASRVASVVGSLLYFATHFDDGCEDKNDMACDSICELVGAWSNNTSSNALNQHAVNHWFEVEFDNFTAENGDEVFSAWLEDVLVERLGVIAAEDLEWFEDLEDTFVVPQKEEPAFAAPSSAFEGQKLVVVVSGHKSWIFNFKGVDFTLRCQDLTTKGLSYDVREYVLKSGVWIFTRSEFKR